MEIEVDYGISQAEHRMAPSGAVLAMTAGEKARPDSGWYASLTLAAAGSLTLAWTVFLISLAVRTVQWAMG